MDGDDFEWEEGKACEKASGDQGNIDGPRGKRGKAAGGKAYQSRSACLVCDVLPVRGHRWCSEHKRIEASMKYQAQKAGTLKDYEEIMGDDARAAEAVKDFCRSTPAGARWQRKPLIGWTQWKQKHGQRLTVLEREGTAPMPEKEFFMWATTVKAQTPTAAATWWKEYEDDKHTERDNKGRGGAQRLWVKVHEYKERQKERYIDRGLEQGSAQMRQLTAEETNALRDFTLNEDARFGDNFLRGNASSSQAALPGTGTPAASGSLDFLQ